MSGKTGTFTAKRIVRYWGTVLTPIIRETEITYGGNLMTAWGCKSPEIRI